jgi:hypothetical protein
VRLFLIDRLIGFWRLLKSFLIAAAASLRHTSAPPERQPPRSSLKTMTPAYQPFEGREKTPRGRPKALAIAGKKIVALRGEASQKAFSQRCKISTDTLQKAERGSATEQTITKICNYAAKKGRNLTPEELKMK